MAIKQFYLIMKILLKVIVRLQRQKLSIPMNKISYLFNELNTIRVTQSCLLYKNELEIIIIIRQTCKIRGI